MTEMLQKSENVAKNVANENSQHLTSQWKKGEFVICNAGKCQYYYVQNEKQQEVIKTEYCLFDDNTSNWQILAPVPTFDEWQAKIEENTQLKELLKECQGSIATLQAKRITEVNGIKQEELLTKIDEALQ